MTPQQRVWPQGPVGDALWAIAVKLNKLNDETVRAGQPALPLQDPWDLAAIAERLANAAQIQGMLVTFESVGAVAVAGWVSALRAQTLDVSSGDEAA